MDSCLSALDIHIEQEVRVQDAQVQGLQIGDCLGLWGDSEAPARGNAVDASRSRIPGAARGAIGEAGLDSRRAPPLSLERETAGLHMASGQLLTSACMEFGGQTSILRRARAFGMGRADCPAVRRAAADYDSTSML